MNDVQSFEQTVQRAKVPPIYLRFHNKYDHISVNLHMHGI